MSSPLPDRAGKRPPEARSARQRLPRGERYRQLMSVAWSIVQQNGTEALTLGNLADRAGVTKPVVYGHFGSRNNLLSALYREFDAKQSALIDEAVARSPADPVARAEVIAKGYVDCVLAQGREIPGVTAALSGSPELERIRQDSKAAFLEKCRRALEIPSRPDSLTAPGLHAMLGAAEALSAAAVEGTISPPEAKRELRQIIIEMVSRPGRRHETT